MYHSRGFGVVNVNKEYRISKDNSTLEYSHKKRNTSLVSKET